MAFDTDSTSSEDCQNTENRQFNDRQVEELLICLKYVIKNVVRVLRKKRDNVVDRNVKEKTKSNIVNKENAYRFQSDIQQLCSKIGDISSSVSKKKTAVPGKSRRDADGIPGTSRSKIEVTPKAIVPRNGHSKGYTVPGISKIHIETAAEILTNHLNAVAGASGSQAEATVPAVSSSHPKATENTNQSKLASVARSHKDKLVPETYKTCTRPEVPGTSKSPKVLKTPRSHIEAAVPGSSRDHYKAVVSTTGHIEAVKQTPIGHTKVVAGISNQSKEVPATSKSERLVIRPEKSRHHTNVNRLKIPRSQSETVVTASTKSRVSVKETETPKSHTKGIASSSEATSASQRSNTKTAVSTSSRHHTKILKPETPKGHTKALPETARGSTEVELSKISVLPKIPATPGDSTYSTKHRTKALVSGTPRNHSDGIISETSTKRKEAERPATSNSDTETVVPRHTSSKVVPESRTEEVPGNSNITPPLSGDRQSVVSDITRYSKEKTCNKSVESGMTKSSTSSAEIGASAASGHRQRHDNPKHTEILDNGSVSKKRRKSQENDSDPKKEYDRTGVNTIANDNNRRKQDSESTSSTNDDSRENKGLHGKKIDLQMHNEQKVIASADTNLTDENITANITNTNLKRTHSLSNDDTAKRARNDHMCTICSKTFHNDEIEEHYKKKHHLHHEIKHNRENYEHKIQGLDNRCHRRTSTLTCKDKNVEKTNNNKELNEEAENSRKTIIEEPNTKPFEQTSASTRDKVADRDGSNVEERSTIYDDDTMEFTNEENKHKSEQHENKVQDLNDRFDNCTDMDMNEANNNIVLEEKEPEKSKEIKAESTNTAPNAPNQQFDRAGANLTLPCDKIAESNRDMEEEKFKSKDDTIDLTSDDNDESDITDTKAVSSAKPIEDDQILNEHDVIDLSDDVYLYDLPENLDTANIEKHTNEISKDNLVEEGEAAFAEKLLAVNVKREQVRNQDDDKNIVKSVFFYTESDKLKPDDNHNTTEKMREPGDHHISGNDKIQARETSTNVKLDNQLNEINTNNTEKLISTLTSNHAIEVSMSVPGSTSAILPIQKDHCKSSEKHNASNSAKLTNTSKSDLSMWSTPSASSANLTISLIPTFPSTSTSEPKLSSATESARKPGSVSSSQNSSQHTTNANTDTANSKNRPKHDSASKRKKHKKKSTKTHNTVPYGNLPPSLLRKRDLVVTAQNSTEHASNANSAMVLERTRKSKSRKHRKREKKSKMPNAIPTFPSELDVTMLPTLALPISSNQLSNNTLPLKPIQLSVIQPLVNLPTSTYNSANHHRASSAVPQSSSSKLTAALPKSSNPSDPRLSKPQSAHNGFNIPSSTTHSTPTPKASNAMSQISKPTTALPKPSNPSDPRLSKPEQSIPHYNIPSTTLSTSVAFSPSKLIPTDSSMQARRRDERYSIPQPTSSHLNPASRIRSPSTDTPTQSNTVSTSSRRASLSNFQNPAETDAKYRQQPQTPWRTPPLAEITEIGQTKRPTVSRIDVIGQGIGQTTRPTVSRTDVTGQGIGQTKRPTVSRTDVTLQGIGQTVSKIDVTLQGTGQIKLPTVYSDVRPVSESRSNPSRPILTPRPSSEMMGIQRAPVASKNSWHTPEGQPGIDVTPVQRPQPSKDMGILEYLKEAGSNDFGILKRFAAAYEELLPFLNPKRKKK